jgi:hypothetical protein
MFIWSRRWDAQRGHYWNKERDSLPATTDAWLALYRRDFPGVAFVASYHKPEITLVKAA